MLSLRQLIASVLGPEAPALSLLQAAAQRGFDGSVSMREFGAAAQSPDTGDFTLLWPASGGSGPWRADRFRIYFFGPELALMPTATQVTELGRLFPQIFNGQGSEVDALALTRNNATTFYRFDKQANGEPTLQFTFDARVLFQFVPAPDLHDDWVAFMQQDAGGFCVQTLKRNFTQANDVEMGLAVLTAVGAATPAAPLVANPLTAVVGGITAGAVNRYHFLAGRRAWRIGLLPAVFMPLAPHEPLHIYYLETAAIDRLSNWLVRLATATGQVGLGDVPSLVAHTWATLLNNWGAHGAAAFSYDTDVAVWQDQIAGVVGTPFSHSVGNVVFDQADFDSLQAMLAAPWVQALLAEHPALADVLP
jgi:hypothetical protein